MDAALSVWNDDDDDESSSSSSSSSSSISSSDSEKEVEADITNKNKRKSKRTRKTTKKKIRATANQGGKKKETTTFTYKDLKRGGYDAPNLTAFQTKYQQLERAKEEANKPTQEELEDKQEREESFNKMKEMLSRVDSAKRGVWAIDERREEEALREKKRKLDEAVVASGGEVGSSSLSISASPASASSASSDRAWFVKKTPEEIEREKQYRKERNKAAKKGRVKKDVRSDMLYFDLWQSGAGASQ